MSETLDKRELIIVAVVVGVVAAAAVVAMVTFGIYYHLKKKQLEEEQRQIPRPKAYEHTIRGGISSITKQFLKDFERTRKSMRTNGEEPALIPEYQVQTVGQKKHIIWT